MRLIHLLACSEHPEAYKKILTSLKEEYGTTVVLEKSSMQFEQMEEGAMEKLKQLSKVK